MTKHGAKVMQFKKNGQQLVQQEIALDTYLSKLLNEAPKDSVLNLQKPEEILTQGGDQRKQTASVDGKHEIIVPEQVGNKVESAKVTSALSVMPEWTQHEFQVLFFKVDKLTLATPLTELVKIIKIETLPTKIPGQDSWFMGLLDVSDKKIGVLDTGQLILGKARGQQRDLMQQPFKNILITCDGVWGLACDEILSIGTLEPDTVRWRTLRKKRPWLVGTVIEELISLIDVNQLVSQRTAS